MATALGLGENGPGVGHFIEICRQLQLPWFECVLVLRMRSPRPLLLLVNLGNIHVLLLPLVNLPLLQVLVPLLGLIHHFGDHLQFVCF
jgi:hypothetical protein